MTYDEWLANDDLWFEPENDAAVVQGRKNAAADPEPMAHARGGNAGSTPAGSSMDGEDDAENLDAE